MWRILVGALVLFDLSYLLFIAVSSFLAAHTPAPLPPQTGPTSDEIALLRAQVEALNAYHADTLTTLWGALAAVATVVGIVALGGAIQSARTYQRDIDALRKELRENVVAEIQALQRTVTDGAKKTEEDLTKTIQGQLQEMQDTITKKLEDPITNLNAGIDSRIGAAITAVKADVSREALSHELKTLKTLAETALYTLDFPGAQLDPAYVWSHYLMSYTFIKGMIDLGELHLLRDILWKMNRMFEAFPPDSEQALNVINHILSIQDLINRPGNSTIPSATQTVYRELLQHLSDRANNKA